jgi:hypothetical protein
VQSLREVQRRAIVGARLEVVAQTRRPDLVGTVRTITRVGPDRSYGFVSSHTGDEEHTGLWPSAFEVYFRDGDTFEYVLPPPARYCIIRLRFLPPDAPGSEETLGHAAARRPPAKPGRARKDARRGDVAQGTYG